MDVTKPGDAKEDEQGERLEDLDALQDEVAAAAEAAAVSAAHAVAATRAIEEISKAREEAEARAAKADTNPRAKSIATAATPEVEASSATTNLNAELPEKLAAHVGNGNQMTKPDLGPLASDAETEPTVPTGESPVNADEEFDGLLNLGDPDVAMPSVLTRIALMALGAAAAIFVVSLLLVSIVPKGTFFDLIILVTWLSVAVLTLSSFALLAAAGIAKVTSSGDQA